MILSSFFFFLPKRSIPLLTDESFHIWIVETKTYYIFQIKVGYCAKGRQYDTLNVYVKELSTAQQVLEASVEAHRNFANHNMILMDTDYKLLYGKGTEVICLPNSNQPFVLSEYKAISGFTYNGIKLNLTPAGKLSAI